jgi:succinoglycan biosynthesis protein ExoM
MTDMTTAPTAPADERAPKQEPVRVTVAVPTFRRPDRLAGLLPLLRDQVQSVAAARAGRYLLDVLVVDNDPERGAERVVAAFAMPGLRYAPESEPGIACARNRALDEAAGSRLLAFIDDDERPRDGWLVHLLDTWASSGAAAVSGRVVSEYTGDLDPWVRAGDFFWRRTRPTGIEIATAATSNLLLDLAQVRASGTRFDAALGLAGGEDTLFSRSLVRAGRRIVWCDESVVVDQVPPERMTRSWVLARALGHGNAALLTDLRLTRAPLERLRLRAAGICRGLVRIAGGGARWAWGMSVRSRRHQARGLRTLLRGAGMVGGAVGLVYEEYARSGRRWRPARLTAR